MRNINQTLTTNTKKCGTGNGNSFFHFVKKKKWRNKTAGTKIGFTLK